MSLKTRFLALLAALVIAASLASWLAYQRLSNELVERWGRQVAEIQVHYDSARLLQSLEREIGLVRQMTSSTTLTKWAQAPDDPALEAEAIRELEGFRNNFRDESYFFALVKNRRYYYNNAENEFAGRQLRYVLNPDDPDDAWFFQLVDEGRDFHLNVNPDTELGVTKLWIDMLLRNEAGDVVAMAGTGLDLDAFLQEIVDIGQEGITTLFVDYNGAIQLYRNQNYIDFASIVKPEGQKNTVDVLFDEPDDQQRVLEMMSRIREGGPTDNQVQSGFVTVDGKRNLAGIAFLPTIGWFEITLVDLNTLLPRSHLMPLVWVFITTLLITLMIFHLAIRYRILEPITSLDAAVLRLRRGDFSLPVLKKPRNEVGRLTTHFEEMATSLREAKLNLEQQVEQRTEELYNLSRTDALTGLGNRRGLDELLAAESQRSHRTGAGLGLIWLDVDNFKRINDELGHQAGDEVLRLVASGIRRSVRPYDHVGRWGGDEFLVILAPCEAGTLGCVADRIKEMVAASCQSQGFTITVSMGASYSGRDCEVDALLKEADQALYRAKVNGRNRIELPDTAKAPVAVGEDGA